MHTEETIAICKRHDAPVPWHPKHLSVRSVPCQDMLAYLRRIVSLVSIAQLTMAVFGPSADPLRENTMMAQSTKWNRI
jgi:hypothetical protein